MAVWRGEPLQLNEALPVNEALAPRVRGDVGEAKALLLPLRVEMGEGAATARGAARGCPSGLKRACPVPVALAGAEPVVEDAQW